MKKTPQHSTKKKPQAITEWPWEDYFCNIAFKMKPINAASLERLALAWAEAARNDPKYINIWQYPVVTMGMHEGTVRRWMEKNEQVKHAHSYVQNLCKIRRDNGAATRELDAGWVGKTMPLYSDEYKQLEEWRAGLSAKIDAPPTKIEVHMNSFPDPKAKK